MPHGTKLTPSVQKSLEDGLRKFSGFSEGSVVRLNRWENSFFQINKTRILAQLIPTLIGFEKQEIAVAFLKGTFQPIKS